MKKFSKIISLALIVVILMSMMPAANAAGNYLPQYTGYSGSIVEALKAVGVDSSFAYRTRIAEANAISNYVGSGQQNQYMLALLKQGILHNPDECHTNTTTRTLATQSDTVTNSTGAFTEDAYLVEITKENAPIRSGITNKASVVTRGEPGAVLQVLGSQTNTHGNLWYTVRFGDTIGYIYAGNVKDHQHQYLSMEYSGVCYSFCDCGNISSRAVNLSTATSCSIKQNLSALEADPNAEYTATTTSAAAAIGIMDYAVMAGSAAAMDGPLPFGEIIGAAILVYGSYVAWHGQLPDQAMTLELTEVVEKVDAKVLANIEAVGSQYRIVLIRSNRNLKCIGNPIDAITAYHAMLDGRDVYAANKSHAYVVGSLHRDTQGKVRYFVDGYHSDYGWRYNPYQYQHIHLGRKLSMTTQERDSNAHLCFGRSVIGLRPEGWVVYNNGI